MLSGNFDFGEVILPIVGVGTDNVDGATRDVVVVHTDERADVVFG